MQNTDFEGSSEEKTKIFAIKTQVGKEQNTADLINSRADKSKIKIHIYPSYTGTQRIYICGKLRYRTHKGYD